MDRLYNFFCFPLLLLGLIFLSNGFVFSVFRPFAELSYENANKEIQEAIEEIKKIS